MAKRKRTNTNRGNEDNYLLIPRGKAYQPFIVIQDVPSLGRSSRPCGIKTGRQHDFSFRFRTKLLHDFRIPRRCGRYQRTVSIGKRRNSTNCRGVGDKASDNSHYKRIDHYDIRFLYNAKDGNSMRDIIRTTKYKKDLVDRRVVEKFAIEKTYWERHGLDWGIVTEEEVDKNYSQNVSDILDYYELNDNEAYRDISLEERDDIIIAFLQRLIDSDRTIRQISSFFEKDMHLDKGAGIAVILQDICSEMG